MGYVGQGKKAADGTTIGAGSGGGSKEIAGMGAAVAAVGSPMDGIDDSGTATAISNSETSEQTPNTPVAVTETSETTSGNKTNEDYYGEGHTVDPYAYAKQEETSTEGSSITTETEDVPPVNDLLAARGINFQRPEIVATTEFIPIATSTEGSESDLSLSMSEDRVIKVTQVMRLIELHRSVNKAVKVSANAFINAAALPDPAVFMANLGPEQGGSAILAGFFELYSSQKSEQEIVSEVASLLKVDDFLRYLRFFNKSPSSDVYNIQNLPLASNAFDEIIDNFIHKIGSSVLDRTSQEDETYFKLRLAGSILVMNDDFRKGKVVRSLVEIVIIEDLLKTFLSYLNNSFEFNSKYSEGIDFKVLSNEYGPVSTSNLTTMATITDLIEIMRSLSGFVAANSEANNYVNLTSNNFRHTVLEVNSVSDANSNMLLLLSCLSKIYGDLNFIDYTNIASIKLGDSITDKMPVFVSGELGQKIKLVKKIRYSSFKDHESITKSFIDNLFSADDGISSSLNAKKTRGKIISEIMCSMLFDASISYNIYNLSDTTNGSYLSDIDNITSIDTYFKDIIGIEGGWKETGPLNVSKFNVNNITGLNIKNKLSNFLEGSSKLSGLGVMGKYLSHFGDDIDAAPQTQQAGMRVVLPSETKDMTSARDDFILGAEYYVRNALNKNDFTFSEFDSHISILKGKILNICKDIIRISGIDYDDEQTTTESEDNTPVGIGLNKATSPLHLFKAMLSNISDGLSETIEELDGDNRFSLWLYLLIASGSNSEILANITKLVYWGHFGYAVVDDVAQTMYESGSRIVYDIVVGILGQTPAEYGRDNILKADPQVVSENDVVVTSNKYTGNRNYNEPGYATPLPNIMAKLTEQFANSLFGFADRDDMSNEPVSYHESKNIIAGISLIEGVMNSIGNELHSVDEDYMIFLRDSTGIDKSAIHTDYKYAKRDDWQTNGPVAFRNTQFKLVSLFFLTHLLNYTCGAGVKMDTPGTGLEKNRFVCVFDKAQLLGVKAVLDGADPFDESTLPPEVKTLNTNGDKPGVTAAKHAHNFINKAKRIISRKSYNILNRMKGLLSHVHDLEQIKESLINYFNNPQLASGDPKFIVLQAFLKNINKENAIQDFLKFLNADQNQVFNKEVKEFLGSASSNLLFNPSSTVTEKQVKLMTIALTRQNQGLLKTEKAGRKSIFHVGIPSGMMEHLRVTAYNRSTETQYLNTNYVSIQIFKNSLAVGGIAYYPKVFIFDMQKFTIENSDGIVPSQIANFSNSWEYSNLRDNFTFFNFDTGGNASGLQASSLLNGTLPMQELVDNHIMNHYLKIYCKLTLGIDFNEYAFPITPSVIKGLLNVDDDNVDLFNSFTQDLILRYPSINVDSNLRGEFNRMKRQIADSLLFSIKNKAKFLLEPKCFDRVFSILINEDDFVVDINQIESLETETLENFYNEAPIFSLDSKIQIKSGVSNEYNVDSNSEHTNPELSYLPKELKDYIKIKNGNDIPTMEQFFATVSLIKSI